MAEVKHVQTNFTSGEISPRMFGRSDVAKYQNGAELVENFFIQEHGGLVRRSGTKFVAEVRDSADMGRLVPFQYSTSQHYVLEFGDGVIRFYRDNGVLNKTITGWSGAHSGSVVTLTTDVGGHQWKVGAKVTVSGFTNADYNQTDAVLTAATHNTLAFAQGGSSSGEGSDAGHTVTGHYEIDAPWAIADVFKINYTQSADVLYIGCPGYKAYLLERIADDHWELAELQWAEQATTHRNSSAIKMTAGAVTGAAITITASSAFFKSSHAGNWIRMLHAGTWGWARLKTFTDETTMVAEERRGTDVIGKAFGAITSTKFWRIFDMNALDGPYDEENADDQWTVDTDKGSSDTDTNHTITATQDTFVATDVGRCMRIYKAGSINKWGVFVITQYVSSVAVEAWMVNDLEAGSGDWSPRREWRMGSWSDTDGWPQVPQFYQNRLYWGKNAKRPETFWASAVYRYENYRPFDPLTSGVVTDSDGLNVTASVGLPISEIRWIKPSNRGLAIGTAGGVFLISGSASRFDPITPTNIGVMPDIFYGAQEGNFPIQVGSGNILYPQLGGLIVRQVGYKFDADKLVAEPISILAEHITEGGLVRDTAYTQQPNSIAWFMRSDGQLATLVHEPVHEVVGWSRQILGGTLAGESQPDVESMAVVHNSPDDEMWMIVKRTIGGATKRYVEYLTQIRKIDDRQDDSFYVDCGLTLNVPKAITAATSANPVVITSTSHGFSNGDKVRIRDVKGMTEINDITFVVADVSTDTFELQSELATPVDIDGSAYTAYVSGGTATKEVAAVSGLAHLEGQAVKVVTDGSVHPDKTVSSGAISLDTGRSASKIHVGLGYTSKVKMLPLVTAGAGFEPRGRLKVPRGVKARFNQTIGGKAGVDPDNMSPIPFRASERMGEPPAIFSGVQEVYGVRGSYELDSQMVIQQDDPMPMTLMSVTVEMSYDES